MKNKFLTIAVLATISTASIAQTNAMPPNPQNAARIRELDNDLKILTKGMEAVQKEKLELMRKEKKKAISEIKEKMRYYGIEPSDLY